MSDTLEVFGKTWTGVEGFKATDNNGVVQTYSKGGGGFTLDEMATGAEPHGDIVLNSTPIANAFRSRTGITSVTMAGTTNRIIGNNCFQDCTNLTSVFGSLGYNGYSYAGCTKLETAVITNTVSSFCNPQYAFQNCSLLEAVDITCKLSVGFTSQIGAAMFYGCTVLETIVLREAAIYTLANVNAFNNSPFKSGGTGGHIYIPKTMYDALGTGTNDYKAATNWSTVDGYGTITWHAIEGSQYENYYVDGTAIPTT